MTLRDLLKFSVKKNLRIHFALANGMECVLSEHGVARVPALKAVPAFNLEDELARAQEFLVESAVDAKEKTKPKPVRYTRDELAALASAAPGEAVRDEHEE